MRVALLFSCIVFFASCSNEPKPAQILQPPTVLETGKAMFQQNCATCHLLSSEVAAPALKGVLDRWGGDSARLRAFIRNPKKAIDEKDPNALKAYEKWKPTIMTAYPQLSDEDLNALIAYFQSAE
jgi:cytochrome c551/c552